jgi:hypothetical protein
MKSPYIIGKPPIIDPCSNCIVSMVCSEECKEKILWNRANPKKKASTFKLKRGKKRENKRRFRHKL